MTRLRAFLIAALTLALLAPAGTALAKPPAAPPNASPLARAHAHNDYEHTRPLFDALDQGFTSVEADIWLVGDKLLIGHDAVDLTPKRTIENLYLKPLADRVRKNHGSVYDKRSEPFQLLVDIKTEGTSTYTRLDEVLRHYRAMLTRWSSRKVDSGAVSVVISGNRPRALMESQRERFAAYDGRLSDLGSGAPASFIPLISDNWSKNFTWRGVGTMPADERAKLRQIVEVAHGNGQRIRFWETPDVPGPEQEAVWRELVAADVDHLNTDHLRELRRFLLANDPEQASTARQDAFAPAA